MDLLLDVNIVLDICTQRKPYAEQSAIAIELAQSLGARLWLYCGSTQTLEYNLYKTLKCENESKGSPLSNKILLTKSRALLDEFTKDTHWLSSLAGEGQVFASHDPEDEQLLRALDRFSLGSIRLLTRDEYLLDTFPQKTISPEQYIQAPPTNRRMQFIDLATQQDELRSKIEQRIHRVLHHGTYIMGPEIKELEARLADYAGVKHAITVASGTDSLEIALRALNIGPGDEVITVPFTWISTAEVIALVGARPVFIDIEPATFNMDVDLLAAAITPRTKAILPVSLFGQMPDYGRINEISARHGNIPVIEDGAQSFGATQHGRRSCGVTLVGSTSFFPAKPCGCYGDGGALFTNDDTLADTMRAIRTHGGLKRHHHTHIGMNGRLDTLQAAILLAKFDQFDWEVERRGEIGARYTECLDAVVATSCGSDPLTLIPPRIASGNTSVYAQYTIRVQKREALAARLKEQGIPCAVYYPKCLHEQPVFSYCGCQPGDFPEAEKASREVLSLPMHPFLDKIEQDQVITAVKIAGGR